MAKTKCDAIVPSTESSGQLDRAKTKDSGNELEALGVGARSHDQKKHTTN